MLKRRRGQNASINPALEEIEVDENTLRASLTCELCEKVLRDANTVVRSLILLLLLLNVVDDDEEEEVLSFSLLLSFSLSISSSSFSLRAQNASTMIYACNIYSLSLVTS
jgi:predicted NACHT family NTPase